MDWCRLGLAPLVANRGIFDVIEKITPPVIVACSSLICGPNGHIPHDYPPYVHVVGFYFVPQSTQEDIENRQIIEWFQRTTTLKTVYLGFGSMPATNPLVLLQLAVQLTKEMSDIRTVIVAGWSSLDTDESHYITQELENERRLIIVKSIPHDWLLPKVDCIVHHCGVSVFIIFASCFSLKAYIYATLFESMGF